jgi:hypothetical protein
LFHEQKLLHCKGDVTSRLCMERYQNVAQYFEDYPPNGISTKLSETQNKYRYSLSVLQAQTGSNCPNAHTFLFLLCKYKFIAGRY